MEKAKLELIVGVFVLIGIACLAYLSIKLGKLEVIGGDVYEIVAQFDTASGLKAGASIEIAGVEVGRVRGITLNDDRAAVLLVVNNGVKLYSDTIASIKTRGIIGEKFLALSPGGGGDPLKPGETIRDTESGLDLEQLVGFLSRAFNGPGNGAGRLYMIVLDQQAVIKSELVVFPAAHAYRILFHKPLSGGGLPCIGDLRPRSFYCVDELGSQGSDT